MNKFIKFTSLVVFSLILPVCAFAEETTVTTESAEVSEAAEASQPVESTGATEAAKEEKPKCLQGIEFLTGFGVAKIHAQDAYHVTPFMVDFDYDLRPIVKKIGVKYPGLLQGIIEPFVSYVSSPYSNAEIGNNFLLKIGFVPDTWKLQPYFKGGVGLIYITQHTREQGTQFNFNEYAGLGAHYFFKKNLALTVEYRYRHISNAGIDDPNHGINTNFGICGVSYLY